LNAAVAVMQELGVDVPIISMAKGVDRDAGREWIHMPGRDPFQLQENDPRLAFLQRLRDEAHRFAIGSNGVTRPCGKRPWMISPAWAPRGERH
jgi:excinuclease ABC subunit C